MKRFVWIWLALGLATVVEAGGDDQQTMNHLKYIGLAIAQWSQDYNDNLPDMKSLKNFKQALLTLVPDDKVFTDARTGEALVLNAAMAGHHWQEDADSILVFTRGRENGSRVALFNDGHVAVVGKDAWEKLSRDKKVMDETGDLVELQLQNLEALGRALLEYVKDGDQTLPPLNDQGALKTALLPYTRMQDVFVRPGTKEVYAVNASLARRKFAEIKAPEGLVVFYEATPMTNNTRAVLFLNGTVERIPEAKWPDLKSRSGIR
jgi:hypothetical protein